MNNVGEIQMLNVNVDCCVYVFHKMNNLRSVVDGHYIQSCSYQEAMLCMPNHSGTNSLLLVILYSLNLMLLFKSAVFQAFYRTFCRNTLSLLAQASVLWVRYHCSMTNGNEVY